MSESLGEALPKEMARVRDKALAERDEARAIALERDNGFNAAMALASETGLKLAALQAAHDEALADCVMFKTSFEGEIRAHKATSEKLYKALARVRELEGGAAALHMPSWRVW